MAQRYRLDPDELSPADLKRAKAGPLEGRNPYELLNGGDEGERLTLLMWCLLSRDNPGLSWAQAEATPFKAFESATVTDVAANGDAPPPTASPGEPGARPEPSASSSDDATKNPNGKRRGSAATTASAPTPTTA